MQRGKVSSKLPFTREHGVFFGLGLLAIIVGYILLAIPPAEGFWSLTAAPIVLVLGYCVLIPIALLKKPKYAGKRGSQETEDSEDKRMSQNR